MNAKRRLFLKRGLSGSTVAVAAWAGLLTPQAALAVWPEKAFRGESVNQALNRALGQADAEESADIQLRAPDIAENGAVVPVTVTYKGKADRIALLVEGNDHPLTCLFDMGLATEISTRVKMGKTSNVLAVVESKGRLFKTSKKVKVTIGGCGG